jgi:hypothetical protein
MQLCVRNVNHSTTRELMSGWRQSMDGASLWELLTANGRWLKSPPVLHNLEVLQ